MDHAANEGLRKKLFVEALELVEHLDRQVEELRRIAPSQHAKRISELEQTILTIRASIEA